MRVDAPAFVPSFLANAKPISIKKASHAQVQISAQHHTENPVDAELHFEDAFDDTHPAGLFSSPTGSVSSQFAS